MNNFSNTIQFQNTRTMITVLSYNVMFNDIHLHERHKRLVELVKKLSPDVICLQEVLKDKVEFFLDNFSDYQPVFESLMPKERQYGELMLVKWGFKVEHRECLPLNSLMGRALLHARISRDSQQWNIITGHLESCLAEVRKDQLEQLWRVYGNLPRVIFCGDTNLRETESDCRPKRIRDLWTTIGGPKITYDAARFWGKKGKERYDRFFFSDDLEAISFRGVGYNPFELAGKDVWISDHDAIIGQFNV